VVGVWAERHPTVAHGGGRQRWPRCAVAPAMARNVGQYKRWRTPLGFLESRLGRLGALEKDGKASSPVAARMARQAAVTAGGGARHGA
jgi:hypothetical protein